MSPGDFFLSFSLSIHLNAPESARTGAPAGDDHYDDDRQRQQQVRAGCRRLPFRWRRNYGRPRRRTTTTTTTTTGTITAADNRPGASRPFLAAAAQQDDGHDNQLTCLCRRGHFFSLLLSWISLNAASAVPTCSCLCLLSSSRLVCLQQAACCRAAASGQRRLDFPLICHSCSFRRPLLDPRVQPPVCRTAVVAIRLAAPSKS